MIEPAFLALMIGAAGREFFGIDQTLMCIVGFFSAAALFILYPSRKGVYFCLCFFILIMIGSLRMGIEIREFSTDFFGPRTVEGTVATVSKKLEHTTIVVRDTVYGIRLQARFNHTELLPGDLVRISGIVTAPKDFYTDTDRIFPYQKFLQGKNISALIENPKIIEQRDGPLSIMRIATQIRHGIAAVFASHVSFPVDGILSGILVGYQGALPEYIVTLFRDTGVLHVLVLSGSNITLFAGVAAAIVRGLPAIPRSAIVALLIILLVLVSGSGIAAVRAGIMAVLALLAPLFKSSYHPYSALSACALFFLILEPYVVLYDPGFHLSFLATFSMVCIVPKVQQSLQASTLRHVPPTVLEIVLLAVLMPIVLMPYTLYFSGVMPMASLPANMVFAVIGPILIGLGVMTALSTLITPFAHVVGVVSYSVGKVLIRILEYLHAWPSIEIPPFSGWIMAGIYTLGAVLFFRTEISGHALQLQRMLQQPSS